ncbi:MAG: hypothetical protein JW809_05795 [Pirellulales bacterium]|nr:hypothetical protein [Pirellulales bacterium]
MADQNTEPSVVRWTEVLPWLLLLRTFRLAIGPRMLVLGAAGALAMTCGWSVLGYVFSGADDPVAHEQTQGEAEVAEDAAGTEDAAPAKQTQEMATCPWTRLVTMAPDKPVPTDWRTASGPMVVVAQQLSRPFAGVFNPQVGVTGFVFWLLCAVWAVAVWAAFGAGITRTAAVQLAAGEKLGLGALAAHVRAKYASYFFAPLFPLLGVLLATIPMLVLGVFLRNGVTIWLGAILWPLALLGGLVMAVLLLGLAVGWPLMWATISAECKDSFDALSRLYAYVFQRPLHYLFYLLVAGVLGILGWMLVAAFAALVIQMTYWAVSWGSGQPRMDAIILGEESLGTLGAGGAAVIRFWVGCVKLAAVGYLYSYFWTAATAIYFLLRRDADATELDEVCLDEQAPSHYTLPPVGADRPDAADAGDEPAEGEDSGNGAPAGQDAPTE